MMWLIWQGSFTRCLESIYVHSLSRMLSQLYNRKRHIIVLIVLTVEKHMQFLWSNNVNICDSKCTATIKLKKLVIHNKLVSKITIFILWRMWTFLLLVKDRFWNVTIYVIITALRMLYKYLCSNVLLWILYLK